MASNKEQKTVSRFENITLVRGLFYVQELSTAISSGDWGQIEDIIGTLTMIFKGAGANDYSTEILCLVGNLKVVWIPKFA